MVIFSKSSLSFKNRDRNYSLLVLICGKNLRFFSWDNSSSWDNFSHDSTNGLDTKGQWGNINQKYLVKLFRVLSTENTTLNSGTISNSLIWVDTSVWFFSVEEIFYELLNFWNSSGSTDKYDFINLRFFHTSIIKYLLNWVKSFFEKVRTKFLESSSSDSFRKINSIDKTFNRNFNLMNRG